MIVLGIDPGSRTTGYAFLKINVSPIQVLEYGVIKANLKKTAEYRILDIVSDLELLIKKYKPNALSMEGIFYAKNVKTALLLGHIRGAILLTCLKQGMSYHEYSPKSVKLAVTGRGGASKESVAHMIQAHLQLKEISGLLDASDALAIAWTHANPITETLKTNSPKKNNKQEWKKLLLNAGIKDV